MLIVQNTAVVRGVEEHILDHFEPGLFEEVNEFSGDSVFTRIEKRDGSFREF